MGVWEEGGARTLTGAEVAGIRGDTKSGKWRGLAGWLRRGPGSKEWCGAGLGGHWLARRQSRPHAPTLG